MSIVLMPSPLGVLQGEAYFPFHLWHWLQRPYCRRLISFIRTVAKQMFLLLIHKV